MLERLFVYGTLGPNRPNAYLLEDIGGHWLEASVKGKLKQKGWGAEMGYPGITLNQKGDKINGFIFSSENLADYWPKLDEFEGDEYQRILTKAQLSNGSFLDVYVYALKD